MKVSIHLPKGMTAGELEQVVVAGMREAERIRRERVAVRELRRRREPAVEVKR